jgi:hypothetical protein
MKSPSSDSHGRTVKTKKLFFKDVTRRIKYQYPNNGIYEDLDGTLTGIGPNTWASPFFKHNVQPECKVSRKLFDGIICNNKV